MHIPRTALVVLLAACSVPSVAENAVQSHAPITVELQRPIQSPMPAAQLAAVQAALPKVAWPKLQAVFTASNTYWYDSNSMLPSYQETGSPGGGANANSAWHNLIANTGSNDPNSNPEVGAALVFDGYRNGFNLTRLISHRFLLDQAVEAINLASTPSAHSMKVMIEP